MIPRKTTFAILLIVAFTASARFVPPLDWYRGPEPELMKRALLPPPLPVLELRPAKPPVAPRFAYVIPAQPADPVLTAGAGGGASSDLRPPVIDAEGKIISVVGAETGEGIVDPAGSMRAFYDALARTEARQPGAITRILHYGDSPVTADSITADARALLHSQFGDAGHGFVLVSKPWAWYGHRGISIQSRGWYVEALSQNPRARDKWHGLGGVSFTGSAGAMSRIGLPDSTHTRVDVLFVKQPGGGDLRVSAGGAVIETIATEGPSKENGFALVRLPAEAKEVTFEVTRGSVRWFGASFEKDGPGVIYSSLGLNGVSAQSMYRAMDEAHWAAQLEHQDAQLIVLNYGTNESVFPDYVNRQYAGELKLLLQRMRMAAPKASILVMSPMDRGERNAAGEIETPAVVSQVVEIQRQAALENSCAFFNTFQAMGGAGTMARWYTGNPRMVSADFMHPLPGGAAIVGRALDSAIVRGYQNWKAGAR